MRVLHKASVGYLLRHPWQLLLALLGITIGVAVIVAVDLANSSSSIAFRLSMDAVTGRATHQIVGGPKGVNESLYTRLRVADGVRHIAPVVDGYVDIGDETLRLLGVDVFAEREFRDYTADSGSGDGSLVRQLLTTPGSMLMSAAAASRIGLVPGQAFSLRVNGRDVEARLAGVFPRKAGNDALANLLVSDIAQAQQWLGMPGFLSRIDVRIGHDEEAATLAALLPAGTQMLSAAGRTQTVAEMSRAFMVNLTAMSLLALLIGVFLINNSVSFAVLQRRNLLGVLRALGLTRGQTISLILGEAFALGLLGSLLGIAAGIVLGQELLQLVAQSVNDLYFQVSVTGVDIGYTVLLKGIVAGLVATMVAALVPAMEASLYAPRLSLYRSTLEGKASRSTTRLAVLGIAAATLTGPLLYFSGQSLVFGLLALFMLIVGVALCIPLFVRGMAFVALPLAQKLAGSMGRLAAAGIGGNLSRTGIAVVALSVAVSATIGISVMVGSFRLAVVDWLDGTLQSDLYVSAPHGGMTQDFAESLKAVPGVADISSSRRLWLESGTERSRLLAVRNAPHSYRGTELIDAGVDDVWSLFETGGAVLVSEPYAYQHGTSVGDSLHLHTDRGARAFQVVAIYRSYDSNPASILISRRIYDMFWDDDRVDALGIYLHPGADSAAVRAGIGALAGGRWPLTMRSNTELRSLSLRIFDRTFLITNVLYWLAVVVAMAGILAAMLALQLERAREFGTLRALGVTRRQLSLMVTLQSGMLGLISGIAAVPLGLMMAWLLIDVINRRAFGWSMDMSISGSILWSAVALAVAAASLAGLYPGWRAGRSQPALAMREE